MKKDVVRLVFLNTWSSRKAFNTMNSDLHQHQLWELNIPKSELLINAELMYSTEKYIQHFVIIYTGKESENNI